MYASLRPIRSPTLLPIRMNAAETSASSAIADWTPLAVVFRSSTTYEIDTFIREVSTTRTNIAIARRMASLVSPADSAGSAVAVTPAMGPFWEGGPWAASSHPREAAEQPAEQRVPPAGLRERGMVPVEPRQARLAAGGVVPVDEA